jgi:hypothetical protein
MVNASAATESLLKHIKPLWMFPALILTACGVEPRLPGPVVREEVGNFQDLAQFDRVPQQVLDFQQVSNFDRSAYKGPLGIDSAMDTSDVVEELRGSRIDFVARYYRDPTSSLPALSSQEARKLASLGLKIVAVWEQNSPDPENLPYSSGYSDAFSAYSQAKAIGQPAGSAIYFAIDFNAHELYGLPGIPRCGRVIRQAYHVLGDRRCQHTSFAANRGRRSCGAWHDVRAGVSASGF